VPDVRLQRGLRVPADSAADALGVVLKAIADQDGPWRGFALHVSLGDLRLPDVGYVAIPIRLTAQKSSGEPRTFDVTFTSANLPSAFPGFNGRMGVDPSTTIGESTLYLRGAYELPMQLFGRLLDAAFTPGVAEKSLENFLEEMAMACEARVNEREAEFARYRYYSHLLR
jgi:hypothetical protein